MDYILDTNILVHLVRGNELIVNLIQKIDKESGTMYISIVSVGEIYSLAYQFGWGQTKLEAMEDLLTQLLPIPIENKEMAKMYAEIDAYSQHKNPDIAMPKHISARNMGKNDLWIAATAYLLEAKLLTMDNDFDHLNKVFFEVEKI